MKNGSERSFTNRHPHVGFRTNPEIKEMLLQLQKDNGGTMSDTVESVVINGLNNICSRSPNPESENDVDVMERFDGYIQNIKDKEHRKGFSEGYHQCAVETREKINGTLNGFNDDDGDEPFTCADCGAEIQESDKFCGNCKKEIDWDAYDDDDSQEKGGIFSGLIDSINNIFDGILGNTPTSDNDNSNAINFTGGDNTPRKTSANNDDDEESIECDGCGAEITEDDDVCPECGEELDWDNESDGEKKGLLDGLKKWNNGG